MAESKLSGGWDGIPDKLRQAAARGVLAGTEAVRTEAVSLILNTAKTGRVYGKHQASAPGEPFASDTGTAVNQIRTSYEPDGLTGYVNSSVEYGAALEFGTENMAPRPYLRPALQNKTKEVSDGIYNEIVKALK
jgi:HK97 gp10 family phage protein